MDKMAPLGGALLQYYVPYVDHDDTLLSLVWL
jgi:hypothetical protein